MATMVVQFGLATMPLGMARSRLGVRLGNDERDVGVHAPGGGVVDDGGAGGDQPGRELARDTEEGAEHSARSMPERSAVSASSTTTSPAPHGRVEPADRAEAR